LARSSASNKMMKDSPRFPVFENPPVMEVVCGVLFTPIQALLAPHFGLLWETYQPDYPQCQEAPPLLPVIENFDSSVPMSTPADSVLQFSEVPPLPRIGFVHTMGTGIIQVQRDRFLHNWRRARLQEEYPRYHNVIRMFHDRLSRFELFLEKNQLGMVAPLQYELTYVNHIPQGAGWTTAKDFGDIFPDFAWRSDEHRFLPSLENLNWQTTFALPKQSARLYVTIRHVRRHSDNHPVLLFELTARGIGDFTSHEAMWDWFDLAHEWIVRSFADFWCLD